MSSFMDPRSLAGRVERAAVTSASARNTRVPLREVVPALSIFG